MQLIIGSGKTAQSAERYCQRFKLAYLNCPSWTDLFKLTPKQCQAARQILLSPGIAPNKKIRAFAQQHQLNINNDIGVFLAQTQAKIILITGTNGKSTIVTLLAKMLTAIGIPSKAIGNIGEPVLDYIDCADYDCYIIEVSSFQLEVAQCLACTIAYITNITVDHLDRHGTMAEYASIKAKVYQSAEYAVLNQADSYCLAILSELKTKAKNNQSIIKLALDQFNSKIPSQSINKFLAPYQQLNYLASYTMAEIMAGIMAEFLSNKVNQSYLHSQLQQVLESFEGLAHRCELVASINGVRWINDSKATNEAACIAALMAIAPKHCILILGGQTKQQTFDQLLALLTSPTGPTDLTKLIIILGEAQQFFQQHLSPGQYRLAASMDEAVQLASNYSKPGDTVLLSPACASLDMYENFQARGECFKQAIRTLYPDYFNK